MRCTYFLCLLTILFGASVNIVDSVSEVAQKHKYDFLKRSNSFLSTYHEDKSHRTSADNCCEKNCVCINNKVILSIKHHLSKRETSGAEDGKQIPGWAIGLACMAIIVGILLLAQCIYILREWCCLCICPCDKCYWERHPH